VAVISGDEKVRSSSPRTRRFKNWGQAVVDSVVVTVRLLHSVTVVNIRDRGRRKDQRPPESDGLVLPTASLAVGQPLLRLEESGQADSDEPVGPHLGLEVLLVRCRHLGPR
jgi:hypothetical protein